jgi:hypothetical protein
VKWVDTKNVKKKTKKWEKGGKGIRRDGTGVRDNKGKRKKMRRMVICCF